MRRKIMRELKEKWLNDFVSLGREIDGVRPESKTIIAIGKIAQIEEKGKNNLKVVLKVAGAKYDFAGFMNDNTPVAGLIKQAKEKDTPICVRFEKKRKKGIDPSTPIEEITKDARIAKDSIVNIVAGVYNFNTESWILTDDAVSNPAEDPDYVGAELSTASYSTEGFFSSPSTNAPKLQTTDLDWKVNHLVSMFAYANEHNFENKLGLDVKIVKSIAVNMLKACDKLQMEAKGIEQPNYNDYSHTKARGMLFSWMRVNPITPEMITTKGAFGQWIKRFVDESLEIWEWAKVEAEK